MRKIAWITHFWKKPLLGLLVAYAVLGLLYLNSVPPFESPDESYHYAFIHHLRTTGGLPVQDPEIETTYRQEGSQPPLYYALAALVSSPFPRGDIAELLANNPHAVIGDPSTDHNYNLFILTDVHLPVRDGALLAVFSVRLLSWLLGGVTVAAVWLTARELAPGQKGVALLAAALTAFNPQFLFIASSINNDNLIAALGSLLLWQTLLLLRHGFAPRRNLILAVLLALACLTKLSGLVFGPVLIMAAGYRAWRYDERSELLRFILSLGGSWLLLAGWWYARNLILYGEFTGTQMMIEIHGSWSAPDLRMLLGEQFTGLRISYWGLFGWFNVFTVPAFYRVMDAVLIIGTGGVLFRLWRQSAGRVAILLLAGQLALVLAGLIYYNSQTAAGQGRLVFPAIASISALLALGMRQWRLPAGPLAAVLGVFALAVPFLSIRPAYAPPPSHESLPEGLKTIYARFEEIELLGYQLEARRYDPGEPLAITLYWRPRAQSAQNYSIFLDLLSDQGVLDQVISFPGYGTLSTSRWRVGQIYEDRYELRLPDDLADHSPLRVHIGWWKFPEGDRLPVFDAAGADFGSVIVEAGVYVANGEEPPASANFLAETLEYEGVRLLAYELEGDRLTLWWETTGPLVEDFHVLAHVLEAEFTPDGPNRILMQGDAAPPMPTRFWRVGERFPSRHTLRLTEEGAAAPAGDYPLYVGWYSTTQVLRLDTECPDEACWLRDVRLGEDN